MDIVWIVLALCLIGTVIWAFQTYITIPAPFSWLKGILTFLLILGACYAIWIYIIANHFHHIRI